MPKFTVHFVRNACTSAAVEAEDYDAAIELAWDQIPSAVCAQRSGWGGGPGIDLPGDWEPSHVYDADNNEVWVDKNNT